MEEEQDLNEQEATNNNDDKVKKEPTEAELKQQWKKEIAENTAMQDFFKQFAGHSVDSFIESYLMYKHIWTLYGKRYAENRESHSIQWVSTAAKHLEIIQQKKLFDAQCLWRAEKLVIPAIQISYDFEIWERNILNCPFIDPVSEHEIELYAEYLTTGYPDDEDGYYYEDGWQDYKEIIKAYKNDNKDRNFPEWYDFYNGRMGTGVYMDLPDIRGEKEEFYMELARKEGMKEQVQQNQPVAEYVPPKFLMYHDKEQRDWFIKTFETKEMQEYYSAHEWSQRNIGLKEKLESHLQTLYEADEQVAIDGDMDWSDAIINAAKKYRVKKTAEALPEAWEQYMMNVEMKIAFSGVEDRFNTRERIRNMYAEGIMIGRKLNGEPEDLNF